MYNLGFKVGEKRSQKNPAHFSTVKTGLKNAFIGPSRKKYQRQLYTVKQKKLFFLALPMVVVSSQYNNFDFFYGTGYPKEVKND